MGNEMDLIKNILRKLVSIGSKSRHMDTRQMRMCTKTGKSNQRGAYCRGF
jgi:hypothetical protein